jgi:hypothetical protein
MYWIIRRLVTGVSGSRGIESVEIEIKNFVD